MDKKIDERTFDFALEIIDWEAIREGIDEHKRIGRHQKQSSLMVQ